jgi:lipoprotein
MTMNRRRGLIFYTIFALLAISSCEVDLTIDQEDLPADISVFGIMSPDTTMQILVSKTHLYYLYVGSHYDIGLGSQLPDATVHVEVNGKEAAVKYDSKAVRYVADCRANPHDHVRVTVESPRLRGTYGEFQVPEEPRMEVLSMERVLDEIPGGSMSSSSTDSMYDSDTLAVIKLKIQDPPGENFYRLRVTSEGIQSGRVEAVQNRFTSGDVVFFDERLFRGTMNLPAYFTNIFSDRYFDGKDYTLTVETRIQKSLIPLPDYDFEKKRVVVELQSLSKGLYDYLKAAEVYDRAYNDTTYRDEFMEGVMIPTNMVNGTGAVGAYSRCRMILDLKK